MLKIQLLLKSNRGGLTPILTYRTLFGPFRTSIVQASEIILMNHSQIVILEVLLPQVLANRTTDLA